MISRLDGGSQIPLGQLRNLVWELAGPGRVVLTGGIKSPALFPLSRQHHALHANAANISTATDARVPITLWHQRLAHLNLRAVSSITGLPIGNIPPCHTCIEAKHQRTFVRLPVARATRPFEVIHSNLYGRIGTRPGPDPVISSSTSMMIRAGCMAISCGQRHPLRLRESFKNLRHGSKQLFRTGQFRDLDVITARGNMTTPSSVISCVLVESFSNLHHLTVSTRMA